jgi:NAD(P)-dependent dehydrogenase (short-subunit alcohol dehydrogenase family)
LLGITPQTPVADISNYFLNQSWDAYSEQFDIHVTATLYTCMAFLELLDAGNKAGNISWSSQVIATGSAQAFNKNPMSGFGYSTSKAAEVHLMKSLAFYFTPHGIRSNILAPGCKSHLHIVRDAPGNEINMLTNLI